MGRERRRPPRPAGHAAGWSRPRGLGALGHELRNPLAAALAGVAAAEAMTAADDPRAPALRQALSDLTRLSQLLGSYLELATGELREVERIDLGELVRGVVARRRGAPLRGVAGPALAVVGNRQLLERALDNLVDNAMQAGAGAVTVGAHGEGGRAVLRVEDDGCGVPADIRPALFRTPSSRRRGGTGLGLVLVADIAAAHGGGARHRPRAGGGSVFEVWLPSGAGAGTAAEGAR